MVAKMNEKASWLFLPLLLAEKVLSNVLPAVMLVGPIWVGTPHREYPTAVIIAAFGTLAVVAWGLRWYVVNASIRNECPINHVYDIRVKADTSAAEARASKRSAPSCVISLQDDRLWVIKFCFVLPLRCFKIDQVIQLAGLDPMGKPINAFELTLGNKTVASWRRLYGPSVENRNPDLLPKQIIGWEIYHIGYMPPPTEVYVALALPDVRRTRWCIACNTAVLLLWAGLTFVML
jgi:hypothetical protein